jgi:hypothetical protein
VLGLAVVVAVAVSWLMGGFASFSLAWQVGLGGPLLLLVADYLLLALTGVSLVDRLVQRMNRRGGR